VKRLEVTAFDARDGDCVLIRCIGGSTQFSVLVDGGRGGTEIVLERYLRGLPSDQQWIDLFVVTHIDSDHLAGAVAIANNPYLGARIGQVWFNGPQHLKGRPSKVAKMSVTEGFQFCRAIEKQKWRWNETFGSNAVQRDATGKTISLGHGLSITILGPTDRALSLLGEKWDAALSDLAAAEGRGSVVRMGTSAPNVTELAKLPYQPDRGIVNASSISFLLRYEDNSILMTADAPAESLVEGLRLTAPADLVSVDLCKFPHHGSAANFSTELAELVRSRGWIVTANGRHGFPSDAAMARMITAAAKRGDGQVTVFFTNDHPQATKWNQVGLRRDFGLRTTYRQKHVGWLRISVQRGEAEPVKAILD
jgi:beta-lactamase superfamily II metal-dependent hydrolase